MNFLDNVLEVMMAKRNLMYKVSEDIVERYETNIQPELLKSLTRYSVASLDELELVKLKKRMNMNKQTLKNRIENKVYERESEFLTH